MLWNGNECGGKKKKKKSDENFKATIPSKNYDRPKLLKSAESFEYLGCILTNDGRSTCEIKCSIAVAKAAFNRKRALFTSILDLELRKKLVNCYLWSIDLYGAETWMLRALDQKNTWKVLTCGTGEGWKRSVGPIM